MRLNWLDTTLFHIESSSSGFIDTVRLERMGRRFKRQYPDADVGNLQWASLAVASWFISQPIKHSEVVAPEVTAAMRGVIDGLGFGTEPTFLNTLWAKAHLELGLSPAIGPRGVITVTGKGAGADVVDGLYGYAAEPGRIKICTFCACPFTARLDALVCSAGCRTGLAQVAA